jgi:Tol biopolymer transport system component
MVSTDGGAPIKLTASKKPETSPRWSPDGRYLAFLSSRDGKKTQVYCSIGAAAKRSDNRL